MCVKNIKKSLWNGVSERRGEGEGREKSDPILVNVYACEESETKYIMQGLVSHCEAFCFYSGF